MLLVSFRAIKITEEKNIPQLFQQLNLVLKLIFCIAKTEILSSKTPVIVRLIAK